MSLQAGSSIGAYELVGPLGVGGMGEVYRARDTRLNREVALKLLPSTFSADPDRLARFTREAQTLALLNHANIAQIYGLEETATGQVLVMELVERETLADRIAGTDRRGIPLDEALSIARQIADAVEAAHDRGIVHRDLKPANVKIRPDGMVKVLDFGLAKALQRGDAPDLANSPTFTGLGTQAGVILGTAAYMAPEQATGKPVDKRTDIWAFGCVLLARSAGPRIGTARHGGARLVSRCNDDGARLDRRQDSKDRCNAGTAARCLGSSRYASRDRARLAGRRHHRGSLAQWPLPG